MDRETSKIKDWLDKRFTRGVKEGKYLAHQPIYGYRKGPNEGRELIRYARILSNLKKISQFKFRNFIDVGGAEGYTVNLVRKMFNVDSYTCDLSFEANLRARELFGLDSVGVDLSNLPFKDASFDIVLCSEVLEHVVDPLKAIYELKRITKKALLITTEAICYDKLERSLQMLLVDLNKPHADRNWYIVEDFARILGENINYEDTISNTDLINKNDYPLGQVENILKKCKQTKTFTRGGLGISVLLAKEQKASRPLDNAAIVDIMLSTIVDVNYKKENRLCLNNKLSVLLRCPRCLGAVREDGNKLACVLCGRKYNLEQGIPLMYTGEGDAEYLTKKWNAIYAKNPAANYTRIIKLENLFKHTRIRPNYLVKFLAKHSLKIKKFINNARKILNEKSANSLLLYLSKRPKERIVKEINRLVNRYKKN